jgi:hypothetical protein
MNQIIENRRVQDRRRIELLARNRRPDNGKNTGANDGANTERSQRPGPERLLEAVLRRL